MSDDIFKAVHDMHMSVAGALGIGPPLRYLWIPFAAAGAVASLAFLVSA